MSNRLKLAAAAALAVSLAQPASAQVNPCLDAYIADQMVELQMPGFAACIVDDGAITWRGAYGSASIVPPVAAGDDTIFLWASVSKMITAVAVLQLYERGQLALDDPIDAHLPFTVRNPAAPGDPITFWMLLTHRSSIRDSSLITAQPPLWGAGDPPLSLETFLREYLTPAGRYYTTASYWPVAPDTRFEYSNVNFTLLGYLVERISGEPFADYCRTNVFEPLSMTPERTGWFLAGLDPGRLATGYRPGTGPGGYDTYIQYWWAPWPAAMLRSSVGEFEALLRMQMGAPGAGLLRPETIELMQAPQTDSGTLLPPAAMGRYGLGTVIQLMGPHEVVGHGGNMWGASSGLWIRRDRDRGVLLVTNGEPIRRGKQPEWRDLVVTLLEFCPTDCDCSGGLDFFDFLCFQDLFAAGDPGADCDTSGSLDFFDFLCFQNAFAAGCP